jgi:nucleotide-binding universal stress UspA family protein
MFRTLLVGIDATSSGDAALNLGIRWARQLDAMLVGIGVIDEPGVHGPEEALVGQRFFERINTALVTDMKREVEQALSRAALRCAEKGVAFKPLEEVGTPATEIAVEAQRFDLVLLGQQTHFRFASAGSPDDTLSEVLGSSPRPVVAVPAIPAWGEGILVAYDGSLQAARALAAFVESGLAGDREINVLCIDPDRRAGSRIADRAVDFLATHELRADAHVVTRSTSIAESILEWLPMTDSGMLVMGAYGQSRVREFFLGSVTKSLLERSPVPIFMDH